MTLEEMNNQGGLLGEFIKQRGGVQSEKEFKDCSKFVAKMLINVFWPIMKRYSKNDL